MNISGTTSETPASASNVFFGTNLVADLIENSSAGKRNRSAGTIGRLTFDCVSPGPNATSLPKKQRPGSSLTIACPIDSSNNSVASLSPRSPGHVTSTQDALCTSAAHLLDISRSQLQLTRRRIQQAKNIEEEVSIWKEFNESSVVNAIANICIQGIDLMKNVSRDSVNTYAAATARSPIQPSSPPSTDTTNQIIMKPKVNMSLSTTHYFWEAILNKGIQVSSISKSDKMTITITLHDYANARSAQNMLTNAKIGDKSYNDLFEIYLRSEATYFIKTQRIIPEELESTGTLTENGIDRKKLTEALVNCNPMWFTNDSDFDIIEDGILPADGSLVNGYVIKLVVQKPIFKKFINRSRPSLMLGRLIIPVRPCMRIDQCFKCLNYGHPTNTCTARRVCRRCGRKHNHSHTKCVLEKRCINCSSGVNMDDSSDLPDGQSIEHQATSNACPVNRARMEELIDQIRNEPTNE